MPTFKTSKARENILGRIRKELNKTSIPMPYPEIEKKQAEQIYAKSGMSDEETFADNFNQLGGKFVYCNTEDELYNNIVTLYENKGWAKMLCAEKNVLSALSSQDINIALDADDTPEDADACITGCELLVARTGSVIITSNQNMGRTTSVFYPTHVIVAYIDQLVPDLSDAISTLNKKYGNELPSMINLNTGPSRTADIEKTLVVGVHGPGEVYCFLVNR